MASHLEADAGRDDIGTQELEAIEHAHILGFQRRPPPGPKEVEEEFEPLQHDLRRATLIGPRTKREDNMAAAVKIRAATPPATSSTYTHEGVVGLAADFIDRMTNPAHGPEENAAYTVRFAELLECAEGLRSQLVVTDLSTGEVVAAPHARAAS